MADAARPLQRGFLSPPMIRIVALFAELGPAVGWAIFIPLYLVLKPAIAVHDLYAVDGLFNFFDFSFGRPGQSRLFGPLCCRRDG